MTPTPWLRNTSSKARVNLVSRSRSRYQRLSSGTEARWSTAIVPLNALVMSQPGAARPRRTAVPARRLRKSLGGGSVALLVVLPAEVGDLLLAHQPAERVLELRLLD